MKLTSRSSGYFASKDLSALSLGLRTAGLLAQILDLLGGQSQLLPDEKERQSGKFATEAFGFESYWLPQSTRKHNIRMKETTRPVDSVTNKKLIENRTDHQHTLSSSLAKMIRVLTLSSSSRIR